MAKIPHVGWNNIKITQNHQYFTDISDDTDVYFTHSYHLVTQDTKYTAATTNYAGHDIIAAVRLGNIFAMQFHPEKSGKAGLKIIHNICKYS